MDEMRWRYVRNLAPFSRTFRLKHGERVVLEPGVNRLPTAVVDALELDPKFMRLVAVGSREGGGLGIALLEGPEFLTLVEHVTAGIVDLNSIRYVTERVKVVERISDPQVLRRLLERSTSVTVNRAITARLKQIERY